MLDGNKLGLGFFEGIPVEWYHLLREDIGFEYSKSFYIIFFCYREAERRKNLLHQFRLWKLLKRKHWNIVVTERAKKEMADRDQDQMRR